MLLPFILAGAAIAAAGYGAKKGYDGYQDKSLAEEIVAKAKKEYEEAKKTLERHEKRTSNKLEKLGVMQLKIGSDFAEFSSIADELLQELNNSSHKSIEINIPQHQLNKIGNLSISATSYMATMAGAGAAGAAAGYAVYGGVMALAAASTCKVAAVLSCFCALFVMHVFWVMTKPLQKKIKFYKPYYPRMSNRFQN